MGHIRAVSPALLLIAAFSRHRAAISWARETAQAVFGPIALESPLFNFTQTDYYASSMGIELKKTFFAFAKFYDPAQLADTKRTTNRWEEQYRTELGADELRPLNLDPGYLNESKLILASTKDHAHRIYLRDGIYAEITLSYHRRQWQRLPWTYPDYQTPEYHAFFDQCRLYLRDEMRTPHRFETAGD